MLIIEKPPSVACFIATPAYTERGVLYATPVEKTAIAGLLALVSAVIFQSSHIQWAG